MAYVVWICLLLPAVAKYCDEHVHVCMCVYLSTRISPEPHVRSLPNFLCMLPMTMAWSYSGVMAICYVLILFCG